MSKVTQAVEMLRVVEETLKQLKEIRRPPQELPSDPIQLMLKIRQENRRISDGETPNSSSVQPVNNRNRNDARPDSPSNDLHNDPKLSVRVEPGARPEAQYVEEDELLAITEKLTQVTQLQDEVLSSLKHDVDALTVENHVLESRNNLLRQENSVLLEKLDALQSEGEKLKTKIIDWRNNMQTQTSQHFFLQSGDNAEVGTGPEECDLSSLPPLDPFQSSYHHHHSDTHSVGLQTHPIANFNNQQQNSNEQLFENSIVGQKVSEVKKKKRGLKKFWKIFRLAKNGNYDLPRAAAIIK